jgi:hypothetical protein
MINAASGMKNQMTIENADPNPKLRRPHARALAILALVALTMNASSALAQSEEPKRRVIPVAINKGENYTINDVKQAETAKVVKNPNALVVQNAPGRIELIGADTGSWEINATLASGEKVTYAITVKSDAPPQGSLNPGVAPPAIR